MPGNRRGEASATRAWAIAWVCLVALWFLLVGSPTTSEVAAAIAAGAIGATALAFVGSQGVARFRPRLRWILRATRLPSMIAGDFGKVVVAALGRALGRRRPLGRIRLVSVTVGGNDARSSARRALAVAGASVAPNAYVVDVDRRRGGVLIHELVPERPPTGVDELLGSA